MSARELITEHLDLWTGAITKKSSSGRGGNGRVELTGIKKLRELILELAAKGKLVEQNPNAESADILLARLQAERLELEKNKKIKKRRKANESTNIDNLTALPCNWSWSQLGEVAFKLTDGSHNPPKDAGRGLPMLSSQNVNFGRIDFERPSRYLTNEDFEKEDARTEARPGDVLLTIVASLGRAAVVPQKAPQFALQRSVAVIGTPISSEFLAYQLIAPQCLDYYDTHGKGTAQKGIYLGKLAAMPIAIPPLEEQHRIVHKVEELMALCDRLEQQTSDQLEAHETLVDTLLGTLTQSENATELADNWARLAVHFDTLFTTEQSIDKLKQTILQLAVMGRLVEQDVGDDSIIGYLASHSINATNHEQPGWAQVSLGDLGEIIGGATPSKRNPEFWHGEIPWVSPKDMKTDQISASQDHVSKEAITNSTLRTIPPQSLLMVVRGMILAHSFPVAITTAPVTINQDMKALVPPSDISPYLLLFLKARKATVTDLVDRSSHGTCKLKSEKLWALPIELPPIREQERILRKVDELMALCDQLKDRLNQASETRLQLAESVVTGATV